MSMNNRKMKNSLVRLSTVYILTFALVVSTFTISFAPRIGAEPIENNPPDIPSEPNPINGSMNVSISANLSWICEDPDGDPVVFDVYFGTESPPELVASNHTNTSYNPGTMNYSTHYYWKIIAWDNQSLSSEGPEWEFTTVEKINSPPNMPNNESPSNGSTGIAIDVILSWDGGDPDEEDTVHYDVYFGNTSDPALVKNNQTNTSYQPIELLDYNTMYYWRIVAWDNHNASTEGPLWVFTTKQETELSVTISKPLENKFYFNDVERFDLGRNTIVYGPITITAEVISDSSIERVEFYADGKLLGQVNETPYEWYWRPIIQFNGMSLTRTIKVVVYDTEGMSASDEINITKWRFHILPWLLVGAAFGSRLILHTTVSGLFYNFQQSRFSVSFYAIRARYRTVGPFKTQRGVLNFKQCKGGFIIGPLSMSRVGLFHRFAYGSFTFIGNIHMEKIGFGQAFLSRMFQRRTNTVGNVGSLFTILRNLRS
ncbi:hypothetical protein AYK25_02970 [Thermoplasmatales archaeon SM1-50]|nr:MAG: hypothetical protein AYK25_02970 [Thermoplasmatales archaeon SM1-50]